MNKRDADISEIVICVFLGGYIPKRRIIGYHGSLIFKFFAEPPECFP